jgi:histidyl-tRNA synthetase
MLRDSLRADDVFSKARAVGQYYGFTPLTTHAEKARGGPRLKETHPDTLAKIALDPTADAVTNFLKQCRAIGLAPTGRQPFFLWHTNIAPGRPAPKKTVVQFHALGSDRALAEAVIIRAVLALVRDLYREDVRVRINSMGDKETRARYAKELNSYFKKRADTLPEECVNCAKRDTLEAAELVTLRACADDLPAPTEHLSDASRKRFEELLEYLEMTGTPYELSRTLISRGQAWNDSCFEVLAGDRRIAWGSHYTELTRHIFPTALPALGAVLHLSTSGLVRPRAALPKHRFSFVHIGDEAKRISIQLAEEFRKAHLPLTQDIGVESLTEQLGLAERRESPYLLIMGRKEALEGQTILRNQKTREETVMPLIGLADRLKTFAPA